MKFEMLSHTLSALVIRKQLSKNKFNHQLSIVVLYDYFKGLYKQD